MSILRHFNKHHGYDVHGKRTPFGGGGGWNPVNAISDLVSSVSDVAASIDPGPAIGSGLAQVDQAVNDLPGGWALPAVVAATVAAPYLAPELAAATAGGEGALTTGEILSSGGFVPTAGSSFVVDPALAYTTGAGTAADIGLGTSAALQGPTYQELGYTGLEAGQMGPTYGELGYTGLNNAEAIAAADAAAQTQQIKDALSTANDVKNAAKLAQALTSQAGSQLSGATSNLASSANPSALQLVNLVRGNQNPFVYTAQQPIQNSKLNLEKLAELLKQE